MDYTKVGRLYMLFLQHLICCPEVENNEGMSLAGFLRYIE